MAVPKKKTSKAKSRSRRASNWVLRPPARSTCPQCGVNRNEETCTCETGRDDRWAALDVLRVAEPADDG